VHEASICVSIRFLSPAGAYGVIERHQLYRRFATNVNGMAIITIVVFRARGCSEGFRDPASPGDPGRFEGPISLGETLRQFERAVGLQRPTIRRHPQERQ
jgi:hypothetical protein